MRIYFLLISFAAILSNRERPAIEGMRSAATVAAMKACHTVSDQAGKVASEAGTERLVPTHFVPPKFDEKILLDEVRQVLTASSLLVKTL